MKSREDKKRNLTVEDASRTISNSSETRLTRVSWSNETSLVAALDNNHWDSSERSGRKYGQVAEDSTNGSEWSRIVVVKED